MPLKYALLGWPVELRQADLELLRFDPGLRSDPSESATATAVYSIYLTPGLGLPTP